MLCLCVSCRSSHQVGAWNNLIYSNQAKNVISVPTCFHIFELPMMEDTVFYHKIIMNWAFMKIIMNNYKTLLFGP